MANEMMVHIEQPQVLEEPEVLVHMPLPPDTAIDAAQNQHEALFDGLATVIPTEGANLALNQYAHVLNPSNNTGHAFLVDLIHPRVPLYEELTVESNLNFPPPSFGNLAGGSMTLSCGSLMDVAGFSQAYELLCMINDITAVAHNRNATLDSNIGHNKGVNHKLGLVTGPEQSPVVI
ncbi:hypothetical protein IFM89_005566 [Coptis chinensis]|uniref:Uncharacterized protein n=1 Tax=Coptis chinensis TaxID=261450 RepID=A0A835H3U7_9MAGN|nr:hypothetical protein IFM89_005566 [Coptis chinensis]